MNNLSEQSQIVLPLWLKFGAAIFSILGLVALAAIEINGIFNQSWITYVLVAFLFIPIQLVTESILSVFWENPKWSSKIIPVILLIYFYVGIYYFK